MLEDCLRKAAPDLEIREVDEEISGGQQEKNDPGTFRG
jgi:hypothetical protein